MSDSLCFSPGDIVIAEESTWLGKINSNGKCVLSSNDDNRRHRDLIFGDLVTILEFVVSPFGYSDALKVSKGHLAGWLYVSEVSFPKNV